MLSLVLPAAFAACSETERTPSDAGLSDSGGGPSPDSGLPGDAGVTDIGVPIEPTPILDRTPALRRQCAVGFAQNNLAPIAFQRTAVGSALQGSTMRIAGVETGTFGNFPAPDPRFISATLGADGELADLVTIAGAVPDDITRVELVALPNGGYAVLWVELDDLRFAAIDAAGAVTVAARTLSQSTGDYSTQLNTAMLADGTIGVLYNAPGPGQKGLWRFLATNAAGDLVVDSKLLESTDLLYGLQGVLVPTNSGFAALWNDLAGDRVQVYFAVLDAQGDVTVPPKQISRPVGDGVNAGASFSFGPGSLSLLPVDGGYLAAWPEGAQGDFEGIPHGAFSVIRVARLDLGGELLEPASLVRSRVDDLDAVEPRLMKMGDDVVLMWSEGAHIYICAGCMPDNRIQVVTLDPASLVPTSNVVELAPQGPGGFLVRQDQVIGSDILSIFQVTFHVHSDTASGGFSCPAN